MPGHVDGHDLFAAEIPLELRHDKRRDESTAGSVDMDGHIDTPLHQQVIDGLDVLVLARVRGPHDGTDANRVLVAQRHRLLGVNDIAVRRAVHEPGVNLKVPDRLLPADLHRRGHDQVGAVGRLALGGAALLPPALHGQHGEHDGLGGAHAGGANGGARGCVE